MKIRALATDIDGTITKIPSAWRYVHEKLNLLDKARYHAELYYKGYISYKKWAELDVALWKGISKDTFYNIFNEVEIREGCVEFFSYLKDIGVKIIAISGGLLPLLEILLKKLHFDRFVANEIIFNEGKVVGDVKIRITPRNKGIVLIKILKELGIKKEECLGIGDSDLDIPMLKVCGYKMVFNPQNIKLLEIADEVIFSETFYEVFKRVKSLLTSS